MSQHYELNLTLHNEIFKKPQQYIGCVHCSMIFCRQLSVQSRLNTLLHILVGIIWGTYIHKHPFLACTYCGFTNIICAQQMKTMQQKWYSGNCQVQGSCYGKQINVSCGQSASNLKCFMLETHLCPTHNCCSKAESVSDSVLVYWILQDGTA